jgi:hypothetical protein
MQFTAVVYNTSLFYFGTCFFSKVGIPLTEGSYSAAIKDSLHTAKRIRMHFFPKVSYRGLGFLFHPILVLNQGKIIKLSVNS